MDTKSSSVEASWQQTARRVYAGYLVLQAVTGIALWAFLESLPELRELVELVPEHREVTDSFVLADLFLGVIGSALSAWALWSNRSWATPALAFTTAALLYPTCYLFIWVSLVGTGSVALAVMVAVSVLTGWVWLHSARFDD